MNEKQSNGQLNAYLSVSNAIALMRQDTTDNEEYVATLEGCPAQLCQSVTESVYRTLAFERQLELFNNLTTKGSTQVEQRKLLWYIVPVP